MFFPWDLLEERGLLFGIIGTLIVAAPGICPLQSGVDRAVIALWLGHESVETTQVYMHADLRRPRARGVHPSRYKPDDALLAFLESLRLCRIAAPIRIRFAPKICTGAA